MNNIYMKIRLMKSGKGGSSAGKIEVDWSSKNIILYVCVCVCVC